MDNQKILKIVTELMATVGQYQVEKFHSRAFKTETKSTDIDVVTEVDKRSEALLIKGLKEHFPTHGILAEESGAKDIDAEYIWVIDPLDGTTNFTVGVPIFAISVGLQRKGETILGAIHVPLLNATYTAIKGNGAFKNGRRIYVNQAKTLRESVIGTGFPYDRAENPINNVKEVSTVATKVKGVRRLGAAAYDFCLVAEGVFDAYWEYGLQPWDYVAGLLIASEAGAVHFNLTKREHSIAVSTPHIFDALKACLIN